MTNALKVQKLAITAFVAVVMAFLFLNLFTVQAHAVGLLDETIDTAHEFSRYPIDNYQLDFANISLRTRRGSQPCLALSHA